MKNNLTSFVSFANKERDSWCWEVALKYNKNVL